MAQINTKILLIATMLGDRYADLLVRLPDRFFSKDNSHTDRLWSIIYHELANGERDIDQLAWVATRIADDEMYSGNEATH